MRNFRNEDVNIAIHSRGIRTLHCPYRTTSISRWRFSDCFNWIGRLLLKSRLEYLLDAAGDIRGAIPDSAPLPSFRVPSSANLI